MSDLIREQDVTSEEDLIWRLKYAINDWSNSIPHHNYKDLGDSIKISKVLFKPSYIVNLQTQFDHRLIEPCNEPYQGENLKERNYYDIESIDVWECNFPELDGYVERERFFSVEDSKHVEICDSCHGQGEVECPDCRGKGETECDWCEGYGWYYCTSCEGNGEIKYQCKFCQGSGRIQVKNEALDRYEDKHCSSCNGKGHIFHSCENCGSTGKTDCEKCDKSGILRCDPCNASGRLTCSTCKGYKKLLHYYGITQNLKFSDQEFIAENKEIAEKYAELRLDNDHGCGEVALKTNGTTVDTEKIINEHFISQKHLEILEQLKSKQSNTNRIVKQDLEVELMKVYEVFYEFQEKEYTLVIYGIDKFVFTAESPISEIKDNVSNEAEQYLDDKNYCESLKAIERAIEMDPDELDKSIRPLKKKIEGKIKIPIKWGSFIAVLTNSFILWYISPLLFGNTKLIWLGYARDMFTENPWYTELHPIVVAVGLIILNLIMGPVLGAELSLKLTKYRVNSSLVRMLVSCLVSIPYMLYALLITLVFHTLGISVLFTWLVHWLMGPLGWIWAKLLGLFG